MKKIIIDADIDPKLPFPGATVEENKLMGKIEWNPKKFEFHLEPEQKTGYIIGNELRKRLEGKHVVNAAFMDYLAEHPDLVPDSWKKDEQGRTRYIYAWGTIFRNSGGSLYVRCWYWDDGALRSYYVWLDHGWYDQRPALSLASSEALGSGPFDLDISAAIEVVKKAGYRVIKEI